MQLPFSVEQFFQVFERYNLATWPAPMAAYVLGIAAVLYAAKRTPASDSIVCSILALFWIWMGVAYHIGFFSAINKAAYLFGALFVAQGAILLVRGALRPGIPFALAPNAYCVTGALFLAYALIVYPLLAITLGHGYPRTPAFGITPCPTTIFTLGLLLWTDDALPKYVLVIPALWSLIGFSAAVQLGVYEDFGLVVAGVVGTAMLVYRDRKTARLLPLNDPYDV